MSARPTEPQGTASSRRLGAYELLVPIARGGMATVFLARHHGVGGFERVVAVKVTHPHLRDDPSWESEFLEEAKLAARVHHPNVVHTLDVGRCEDGPYLVMDYVDGDSLAGLIAAAAKARAPMPAAIGLAILCDALSGLHAAHELRDEKGFPAGLVHRDVSPQNVLVGVDGVARLTDFGIAKAAGRTAFTTTGVIKGKIAYMAPEQLRGQPLDRRCDIWAAGIVAWELLAKRAMFLATEEIAVAMRILEGPPPKLRTVDPEISPELEVIVATALAVDASARYGTADALRRDLAAAAHLATTDEVAAYVSEIAEPKLEERRFRVQQVRRERAVEAPRSAASRGRSPARWGAVAGGVVLLTAASLVAARRGGQSFAAPVPPPESSSPAIANISPEEPTSLAAAPPSAPQVVSTPSGMVQVTANARIRQIRVGSRTISILSPASAISLEIAPAERAGTLTIEALSTDGRRATQRLPSDARDVSIAFPEARPRTDGPRRPASSASTTSSPGLAKDPYDPAP